jgi:hydroxypyruvate isomerase
MEWNLRYSPHVGYVPPADLMLFRFLAGNDRAAHVRFAAREKMAGILYPWAVDAPPEERHAVKKALQETGLECSCVVATPMSALMEPVWVADGDDAQSKLFRHIEAALQVATDLGSKSLAVLLKGDGHTSLAVQRRRAIDRLRAAADLAAASGSVLAIEPMIALPEMLLRTFAEGVELLQAAAHPAIKLIFDTGHVTDMGDPLFETYSQAYDHIQLLQIADMPGRVEVGGGTLGIVRLLAYAIQRRYQGLVDLEHDWLTPGAASERRGIETLMTLDAQARQMAGIS